MKQTLHILLLLLFANLYADDIQMDAVQHNVVQRAPYLKNVIDAYNCRLSCDEQPQPAIREFTTLLHRFYRDFDPQLYQYELLKKYGFSGEQHGYQTSLAKSTKAFGTNDKINDGGGDCWHVSAAQSFSSSLILAVWQDERNGVDDPDIYGQFFNLNMQKVGGNFVVHTENGGAAQNHPVVAELSDGGFVVVWEDYRKNDSAIYARRFAANRSPVGSEFMIELATGAQLKPAVSVGNGQFTITWLQNGGTDYNVYARVYNNNATAVTPTFLVNDNKEAFQWFPVIASANSGESLVVWEDKRNGKSDIFAQRLRADGSKRAGNFQVDDAVGNPTQWQPDVTAGAGQFVVTWEDFRDAPVGIYAQWFNSALLADGDNVRVDDDLVSAIKELPSVAINDAGETTFCWQDGRESDFHLCAQTFDANKNAELFLTLVYAGGGEQRFPDLLMNDRVLSFFWVQSGAENDPTSIHSEQVLWSDVPVELAAFSVTLQDEQVVCSWTTLSETNNLGFSIERSADGLYFKEIGFIDGHGTSAKSHTFSFIDCTPPQGDVAYRLKQIDFDGSVSYSEAQHITIALPVLPILLNNYPNPFNPLTTISFQLDQADFVRLDIVDVHGRLVTTLVNAPHTRGIHKIVWDGRDSQGKVLVSGVYFCILKSSKDSYVSKMILAR